MGESNKIKPGDKIEFLKDEKRTIFRKGDIYTVAKTVKNFHGAKCLRLCGTDRVLPLADIGTTAKKIKE